ncbi:hypothetical protein WA158_003277 [Blastocystis sp. Blastoise]
MSTTEFKLTEDKYLFTFQDETQLWISKEFIEKYQQLPFYDIIEHSDKYEDGSYYIDMLPFHMEKVIKFLIDDDKDISSLNLRDSFDIYKTLTEYLVTIDNEFQSDLLFHVKELFYKYLKDNNYDVYVFNCNYIKSRMPMELFSLKEKEIRSNGLFTPQRKDELLYYSLLIKMMNITKVEITYAYSSNIPLEYICPSCIQDIFPSLKELKITVNTHYKKTELLLNPNSDEYMMEYARLLYDNEYRIYNPEEYEYYTESDMNEYNKISSFDFNKLYNSHDLIDSYNERRQSNQLRKLYKNIVNEGIYENDYSNVEISKKENEYTLYSQISIKYDDEKNDKTYWINNMSSKLGISQLLLLPSYLGISQVMLNTLNGFINEIDKNLFNIIIATDVFLNITELIYDSDDKSFQLSLIKKECFPKLHIINYKIEITTDNFDSLFPVNIMSVIDTIRINDIDYDKEEEIALLLDNLVYTHSIHIYGIDDWIDYFPHLKELLAKKLISFDNLNIDSSDSENIKILDLIENSNLNIDSLNIRFKDDHGEIDKRNSLERFLKSNILEHLNKLSVRFHYDLSMEYLEWISTLFNDNKFNNIKELTIDYDCRMTFLNRLIHNGCFHNTTQLIIRINDIPDDDFLKLYTTDNFPQLKSIKICKYDYRECWISFIQELCTYMNNNNFPFSSIVRLNDTNDYYSNNDYINDPNYSILRCKYDKNSYIDTIINAQKMSISKYEMETLFECINENITQNIKSLQLDIYEEEQLSKLINFITIGKFPKLKEFLFNIRCDISDEQIDIYEQQLSKSSFIRENHVDYKFF